MCRYEWTRNPNEDFYYESMLRTSRTITRFSNGACLVSPDCVELPDLREAKRWVEETESLNVSEMLGLGYVYEDDSFTKTA